MLAIVEAIAYLAFARVVTLLLPMRRFAWLLGTQGNASPSEIDAVQLSNAAQIGRTIESVARRMPFRAVCLEQAISARLMLNRRRIASTLYLGLLRDREERSARGTRDAAHAWVRVGSLHVVGGQDVSDFIVVSSFS